jgi:hypothetical protein
VECWNIGHEKRKTDNTTRIVESAFFENAHQAFIFCFFCPKIIHKNKKINEIICILNMGLFKPIIPRFQHSIIPRRRMSEADTLGVL